MLAMRLYLFLFLLLTLSNNIAISQDTTLFEEQESATTSIIDTLTPINKSYSDRLLVDLNLDTFQKKRIDSVLLQYQNKFSNIETRRKAFEISELSEDDIIKEVSILSKQRTSLKEEREIEILLELNERQKILFEEKVKTKKPPVLHFGIHNRADCIICE